MDLSAYDLLDTFTLHDAAYLLCGHEPLSPGLTPRDDPHEVVRHKAYTIANQLVSDAETGRLIASKRDIGESWVLAGAPEWIATRQALEDWATEKNQRPAFLFPEERKQDIRKPVNKESEILSENLLKAVVCMAVDGYGYKLEDRKSPIPKELSDMFAKQGHNVTDRTIRDWLKRGKDLLAPQ